MFEQEFSMEVFACLRALKPNVIVGSPRLWNFVYHEYERALHELRGEGAVQSRDAEGAHSTTLHTGAATFVLQNERGTELEDSLVELFYAQYFGGRAVGLVTGLCLTPVSAHVLTLLLQAELPPLTRSWPGCAGLRGNCLIRHVRCVD